MSFHTLTFFVFLPVVFALYWSYPGKKWQNVVAVGASFVFYSWWDWRFSFLMLVSSLIDYVAGILIDRSANPKLRKVYLISALSGNLAILAFFKYFRFFVDSLSIALSSIGIDLGMPTFLIILPVGISFYTFQSMSYTIDIYRRQFEPQRSIVDYLAFVTFFPQLVAGPIERASHLLPQFRHPRTFSYADARWGLRLMLWGLAKKMLVADHIAPVVNGTFASVGQSTGAATGLAVFFFSFQIYCDFSAYSDIAAGTASLFGIKLMRNFAYPYFSQTITEFWRRWHISLSTWFKDYVYLPLGGNRVSPEVCYRNLLIICLVSGLWHGSAFTFIVWGLLHGVYLVVERALGRNRLAGSADEIPGDGELIPSLRTIGRILWTFALVAFAWVFFRAESLHDALLVFRRLFFNFGDFSQLVLLLKAQGLSIGLVIALVIIEWVGRRQWNPVKWEKLPALPRWMAYSAACWCILLYGTERVADFIYFRF